jgi:hypothetical protein
MPLRQDLPHAFPWNTFSMALTRFFVDGLKACWMRINESVLLFGKVSSPGIRRICIFGFPIASASG